MKLRKLNPGLYPFVIALMMLFVTSACNNSDKEEKTSTTALDTSVNRQGMVENDTSRSEANKEVKKNVTPTNDPSGSAKITTKATTGNNTPTVYARMIMADSRAKSEMDKAGWTSYPETMPRYPGGQPAIENYITNNVEYPQAAIDNNIEGTVFVLFLIEEDGKIAHAKLYGNKLGYGMDEAVLKAILQMPQWTPGKTKGNAVRAWYTFPVTFLLKAL